MFETTETSTPIISTRQDAGAVRVLKGASRFLARAADVNGAYAILEQVIPPGGGPALHVHRHETEIFYVVEGEFEIRVGDQTLRAGLGTCAVCPRDIPHGFRNVSTTAARLHLTVFPGRFGEFFERVDAIDPDDAERIQALLAEYDVELLE